MEANFFFKRCEMHNIVQNIVHFALQLNFEYNNIKNYDSCQCNWSYM